jgi:peptide deformylase
MAVLPVLTVPDPRLKEVCAPVEAFDDALAALVADLEETRRAGPAAVGIAAPQVGRLVRVAVVDVSGYARAKGPNHGHVVLVNPEITSWDGLAVGREGCLSVPDFTGDVVRAERIRVVARDVHGEPHEYDMEGFEARAVQHEIDHLDGILFLDRLVSRRTDLYRRKSYR